MRAEFIRRILLVGFARFLEALIRRGTDLGNWASRAGSAAVGVVPTRPAELSLYAPASAHLARTL